MRREGASFMYNFLCELILFWANSKWSADDLFAVNEIILYGPVYRSDVVNVYDHMCRHD